MSTLSNDLKMGLDPVAFSRSIGIDPDPWQAEVLRHKGKRMLLNCCRQSGKSTTTATKALHTALYHDRALILLISPSLRQSQELFRKVKAGYDTLKNPPVLLEDNKLSLTLANQSRIVSLPGDQATVRGYSGVTMILEDEASQVSDELYQSILPMLMVSDGQLILMTTPFGKRGHFFEEWTSGNDWTRIAIKGTDCPRFTEEKLDQQRRSMGDMFYRQEFECQFVDTAEQTFQYELIQKAFDDSIKPLF